MSGSTSTIESILAERFRADGYSEARLGVFVKDFATGLRMWVSPRVTKEKGTGSLLAAPLLGVIAVDVEQIVAACRPAKSGKQSTAPTLSIRVGYLLRGSRYREWQVNPDNQAKTASDVAKAVVKASKRLQDRVPDLRAVGHRLQESQWTYRHQARYRIPPAALLLDAPSAAATLLKEMVAEASTAGEEVASSYSAFAQEFRRNYLD